ncbi:hypothetical protein E2562_020428 [Oryza meyeriana var. granulata]|uniref:Uncharacterized protein n=1 Tax=Oryza meyeriana var. granulata TaxID=110450 RepID=A0A6G1D7A4_9ORYZ|nr:hypothetical protein E2562_020428 [Oryza meyeriana var. granulata]
MQVQISNNNGPIAAIRTRTNSEGRFMETLNVTSSDTMDSMMGGDDGTDGSDGGGSGAGSDESGSKMVVTTPPMTCNASLPTIGILEAPVVPLGARTLDATPVDNILREILNQSVTPFGTVDAALDEVRRLVLDNASVDILRELTDSLPTGVSYGGNTLDAYIVFGVGPFSYPAIDETLHIPLSAA